MAELTEKITDAAKHVTGKEEKYLTFNLSAEEYGINILKVKEIIGIMPCTALPQTPEFVRGVINLRGKVIPIIDLRLRFSMEEADYTEQTCIIVVEITKQEETVHVGIVVDSVSEVLNIKGNDVEETPQFGAAVSTDFILGMAKMEGSVKILLDIDRVLAAEEIARIENVA